MASCRVSLLLIAALLVVSQPVSAYRRMVSSSGGIIHQVGQRRLLQGDNPCGSFDPSDPFDGVRDGTQTPNLHQPCYDGAGNVLYCCLSGSTQCACAPTPPGATGPFQCYNYVANNGLNANTGEACGFFLPGQAPPPAATTPSPTSTAPSPTSTVPSPTSTAPSPTSTPPSSTSAPGGSPAPCPTVQPRGPPGSDGTCGNDPAGQAYNLCTSSLGVQFCCPSNYVCPTADPVVASNPLFSQQVYCQALGPCGY